MPKHLTGQVFPRWTSFARVLHSFAFHLMECEEFFIETTFQVAFYTDSNTVGQDKLQRLVTDNEKKQNKTCLRA